MNPSVLFVFILSALLGVLRAADLAFGTDDYEALHKKHQEMGCICYENPGMGIYFIEDPDGYWLEIVPTR